jgi:hypothetical protein
MQNKKTTKIIVILGDLISSKKSNDKNLLIRKLDTSINSVNKSFSNEIFSPMELMRGDEISTVLLHPKKSFEICYLLNKKIFPDLFRFVVVSGDIDNDVLAERKNVNQMTGEVFYKASKMLFNSKKNKLYYDFSLDFRDDEFNQFINVTANFLQLLLNKMTAKQREAISLYEKLLNQEEVAKKINKSQQTVSLRLKSSSWDYLEKGYNLINRILNNYNSYKQSGNNG